MYWLIVTILAYFCLAIVSLFDRYFLVGPIPNPKGYTFYVGILWFLISLFLIPFGITLPKSNLIILGLIAGLIRIFATLFLTKAIVKSEISRVVPAIGGLLPIFIYFFFFLYLPKTEILNLFQLIAFVLLVLGSVLISLRNFSLKDFNLQILKYPTISAFLFALSFFLTKILFLKTNFLTGLFLILIGGGLGAVIFLFSPSFRKTIFGQKITPQISVFLILGQAFGGLGVLFQFYAIFLAKPDQVPLINALEGIRYVFLLFFAFVTSLFKPKILKEEIGGRVLYQKIFAIFLISFGLAILSFQK
jgi:drug/metabolite transporter (DMT)-like permease